VCSALLISTFSQSFQPRLIIPATIRMIKGISSAASICALPSEPRAKKVFENVVYESSDLLVEYKSYYDSDSYQYRDLHELHAPVVASDIHQQTVQKIDHH
jgi:hypothetical protein